MPSEHINLKLKERYMDMIKDIANTMGIKDLSKVHGAIPLVLRFSITYTHSELKNLYSVIPTLHPDDLHILLQSIKDYKTSEYHKLMLKNKKKLPKE